MTNEPKGITDDWVEKQGARYAYAFDKGGKLQRWAGVSGIPYAILVNPEGTIVWRGHPAGLQGKQVERALVGALPKPLWELSPRAGAVKKALLAGKWDKALAAAQELGEEDDGPALVAVIEATVGNKSKQMKAAYEKGDFYGALTAAEILVENAGDLPAAAEAEALIDKIKDDKEARPILKGQAALAKIREKAMDARKKRDVEKQITRALKLRKKYEGTIVAEQAGELISALRKKVASL